MTPEELRAQAELDGALPGNRTDMLLAAADEIERLKQNVRDYTDTVSAMLIAAGARGDTESDDGISRMEDHVNSVSSTPSGFIAHQIHELCEQVRWLKSKYEEANEECRRRDKQVFRLVSEVSELRRVLKCVRPELESNHCRKAVMELDSVTGGSDGDPD